MVILLYNYYYLFYYCCLRLLFYIHYCDLSVLRLACYHTPQKHGMDFFLGAARHHDIPKTRLDNLVCVSVNCCLSLCPNNKVL